MKKIKYMLITPALKDKLLTDILTQNEGVGVIFDIHKKAQEYKVHWEIIEMMLDQFKSLGFISVTKFVGGKVRIIIHASAHDHYNHGGFVAQEELLKANIQKLGYELDLLAKQLSPDFLDRANAITSIGHAILSSLALFNT